MTIHGTRHALLGVCLALFPLHVEAQDEDAPDVDALVATLLELKDDANSDLIRELASIESEEALEGLLRIYDAMASIYMRRVVLYGLIAYDDVPGANRTALEKLTDVATDARERDLRLAAVEAIGDCENLGHSFLMLIVESGADDEIRELALRAHVDGRRDGDEAWYRVIFEPIDEDDLDRGEEVPFQLESLRALAFDTIAPDLDVDEVAEATEDKNREIRVRALIELESRGDKRAFKVAEELYGAYDEQPGMRVVAAGVLLRLKPKMLDKLIKNGTRKDAPREFSVGLANLIAEIEDPAVQKKILKKYGKGNDAEKLFYIRAGNRIQDPKIDKALVKLIGDKKPWIRRAAMMAAAERNSASAIEAIEEVLAESEDFLALVDALDALSLLYGVDPAWSERLGEFTRADNEYVRNAAVSQVGKNADKSQLPLLEEALGHERWSTRLAAAHAIQALGAAEGVGALCRRMSQEEGRMLYELGDILWSLTGQPFGVNARSWVQWWEAQGASFRILTEDELARVLEKWERRRLMERDVTDRPLQKRPEFFGIRILSHRVLFIIDVSGSMEEETRGKYIGQSGLWRLDVAKKELTRALEAMDLGSLYNIVTFSSDADPWQDGVSELTEESLAEAVTFVKRLRAGGGTNIYRAIEYGFEDTRVDTIFLLSDGEPTMGPVTDPYAIREAVARWNKHRGITIHCIAVGGDLETLKWLAEDSGGTYVKYP